MDHVIFYGYPRRVGGCGTQLAADISLLQSQGVHVSCMSSHWKDPYAVDWCRHRGVTTLPVDHTLLRDALVVSEGSQPFLCDLPHLLDSHPARLVHLSCMGTPTDLELKLSRQGLLDDVELAFVGSTQQARHLKVYQDQGLRPQVLPGYHAYYDPEDDFCNLRYQPEKHGPKAVGRVSRDDPSKALEDMWEMYLQVNPELLILLGTGENTFRHVGQPPATLNLELHTAETLTIKQFHERVHVLAQAGASMEAMPRYVLEAMAAGTPAVVLDDPVFREIADETCLTFARDTTQMADLTGALLDDDPRCRKLASNARARLEQEFGKSRALPFWKEILGF